MAIRWGLALCAAALFGCSSNNNATGTGTGGTTAGGDVSATTGGDAGGTTGTPDAGTTGAPDAGPGPSDTTTPDAGPGPSDTTTPDAGPGPSDTTTPDAGPGPGDTTTTDAGPGPGDTSNDAGPGPTCADAPTCECVITECAAGLGVPAETACGVLAPNTACLAKLVGIYQAGGCGTACGGITLSMWNAICEDADCAGVKAALTQVSLLTTQCTDCACTADCTGKTCGDDGCGGSCGTCTGDQVCKAGTCGASDPVPTNCAEAHGSVGCCANGDVFWFEGGSLQGGVGSCGGTACGWDPANSFYSCASGVVPGSEDPTGTYPIACGGTNPSPDTCPVCSCEGKACGDDGCGTSCGTCAADKKCGGGQCVALDALTCVVKDGCTETDPCLCVTCQTDNACTLDDDCVCPDCATDGFCSDPGNCVDDGECDMFNEGCGCTDCAAHPSCATN